MSKTLLITLPCLLLMACTGLPLGDTDPWSQAQEESSTTHNLILVPETIHTVSRWTGFKSAKEEACHVGHHDGNTHRCLMRFQLGALPTNATILSATLHMRTARVTHIPAKEEVLLRAAPLQNTWDADNLHWDKLPTTGSPHHDISMHTSIGGEDRFSLNAIVRQWIQDPKHNHGLVIQSVFPGQVGMKSYQGFKGATLDQGPRLHIVYRRPASPVALR